MPMESNFIPNVSLTMVKIVTLINNNNTLILNKLTNIYAASGGGTGACCGFMGRFFFLFILLDKGNSLPTKHTTYNIGEI